jgi:hypothetical protein
MTHLPLNHDHLKLACLELARNIAWHNNPITDVFTNSLADIFLKEALFHEEFLVNQERDPNIITWAVSYLAHAHAIPPMGVDVAWFRNSLSVVVELCCPNSMGRCEDENLYRQIEIGIGSARNNYNE